MARLSALVLAAAATFAIGGTASAKAVRAKEPASVSGALEKAGYPAELTKDEAGDPMIRSRTGGSDFVVHFYGCEENRNCTRVQFLFSAEKPRNGSIEALNAWNSENYFGRAYRAEEDVVRLEMDVDLDDGGMSTALFEDNLEWWASIVDDFERRLDAEPGVEGEAAARSKAGRDKSDAER